MAVFSVRTFCLVSLFALHVGGTAAAQEHYFYGVRKAAQAEGKVQGTYFISMGSFSSQENAQKLAHYLRGQQSAPVKMTRHHGLYNVAIGPLHSTQQVRAVAREISPQQVVHAPARQYSRPQVVESQPKHRAVFLSPIKHSRWDAIKVPPVFRRLSHPHPEVRQAVRRFELNWHEALRDLRTYSRSLEFSLGAVQSWQGKAQDINIEGLIGDYFSVNSGPKYSALFGVGYYITSPEKTERSGSWQMAYGLDVYYNTQVNVSGYITQEDYYTNLSYQYQITNLPFMFDVKSIVHPFDRPYSLTADVGIGPNLMMLRHYQETSLDGGLTVPDNAFNTHEGIVFAATAGVGLRADHLLWGAPLECGYRFFYFGEGQLSNATQIIQNRLSTGPVYGNSLLCRVIV